MNARQLHSARQAATTTTVLAGRAATALLAGAAAYSTARALAPRRLPRPVPTSALLLLTAAVIIGETTAVRRRMARLDARAIAPVQEAFHHGRRFGRLEERRAQQATRRPDPADQYAEYQDPTRLRGRLAG